MLVAVCALQLLPASYSGLALIVRGGGLLVAEHFALGFGILGIGRIAATVIGSIMLIDSDAPGYSIRRQLIAGVTAASIALPLVVLNFATRAHQRPVMSGRDRMLGTTGEILTETDDWMSARIRGELFNVRANAPLGRGQSLEVVGIDGLVLAVEPTPTRRQGS